jgi:hypothetical protein
VFIQDVTAGHRSHTLTVIAKIKEIYHDISASDKIQHSTDLRIGVVAYKEYQRCDVFCYPFSSDIRNISQNLESLVAPCGGGTISEALYTALDMSWRVKAHKMIVITADALPHGIDQPSAFPWGLPEGEFCEINELSSSCIRLGK